jgi:hypothetical protein
MNALRAGALSLLAATTSCGVTIVRALALDPLSRYVVGMRSGVSWSTCSWRSARLVGMSRRWDGAGVALTTKRRLITAALVAAAVTRSPWWCGLASVAVAVICPRKYTASLLVARCSVATRNRLPTLHTRGLPAAHCALHLDRRPTSRVCIEVPTGICVCDSASASASASACLCPCAPRVAPPYASASTALALAHLQTATAPSS